MRVERTSNGIESLHNALKVHLKQSSNMDISSVVSEILDIFLPRLFRKYIHDNRIITNNKSSKDIPKYLHSLPSKFVKFILNNMKDIDYSFEIKKVEESFTLINKKDSPINFRKFFRIS